jgi:hypothetical protein
LFPDGDPSEVVAFVDAKLLNRGLGAKVFSRRTVGVEIRPAVGNGSRSERKAARAALPHASIYRPRLTHPEPRLYVWSGPVPPEEVPGRLGAGGVAVSTRPTSGGHELEVPEDITAPQLVGLALAALRALGPAGPGWEWEAIVEVDTSSID